MARLQCGAHVCIHNEQGLCSANNILIEGVTSSTSSDTFCANFVEERDSGMQDSVGDFNYMGGIVNGFSNHITGMNPQILCKASNCTYNLNGNCEAKDVNIYGSNNGVSKTMCETYK